MIFPEATGLATVFVAQNPHGYWRRDPESNRADRICNPLCNTVRATNAVDFIGKPAYTQPTGRAVSCQSGRFFPEQPTPRNA